MTLRLIFEIFVAVILCGVVLTLLYTARRMLSTPVPETDGATVYAVVAVSGEAKQLEQTVNGILWLEESGTMRCRVVIADMGLYPDARRTAEIIAQDDHAVLCGPRDIAHLLEDFEVWKNRKK